MATNGYIKDSTVKPEPTNRSRIQAFFTSTGGLAIIYLVAITIAESTTVLIEPRIGLILHGCVLVAILFHSALVSRGFQQNFLLSLILAPLVRLLSLSLPLTSFQFVYWYAIIGAPLLITAFLTARVIGLSRSQMGLTLKGIPLQLSIGTIGIALGLIEYYILHPAPLSKGLSFQDIWLPALILLFFTGFLEEVIFRGVMHNVSLRSLSRYGILYVSLIFAVLHLGYKSIPDVIFVFAVAMLFGYIALRTGSILGVTIAHGLTNIGLFLIFPFIIGTAAIGIKTPSGQTNSQMASLTSTVTKSSPTLTAQSGTKKPLSEENSGIAPTTQKPTLLPPSPTATTTYTVVPSDTPTPTVSYTATLTNTLEPDENTLTPSVLTATIQPTILLTTPTVVPYATQTITSPLPSPYGALIDDGDLEFLRSGGEEYLSSEGFTGDFVWTTTTDGNARVQIEWRPTLVMCGTYKVEVYIPSGINLTKSAFYKVGYRQGMSSRLINQSAYGGSWVSLGEYEFLPTSGTFLRLTNSTGEPARSDLAIVFDAARWTLISSCSTSQP
jgi:membrane protease YdiL (CAAX protease family)